jgi:hypothetical protein
VVGITGFLASLEMTVVQTAFAVLRYFLFIPKSAFFGWGQFFHLQNSEMVM